MLDHPLIRNLLMLMRSHDRSGAWDNEKDEDLLAPFIVTKAQKREIPLIGEPDPDILWRVELFYAAIAMSLEKQSGITISPLLNIHHEGWGRIVLIAGKLVAVSVYVRELHRFGFEDLPSLVAKGEKLIAEGLETIRNHSTAAAA